MLPPPNSIAPGTLEPNEVNADALFARIAERTADLVLHGPSTDAEPAVWVRYDENGVPYQVGEPS